MPGGIKVDHEKPQDSLPDPDSNRAAPNYRLEVLSLDPTCSVNS